MTIEGLLFFLVVVLVGFLVFEFHDWTAHYPLQAVLLVSAVAAWCLVTLHVHRQSINTSCRPIIQTPTRVDRMDNG